MILMVSVMHAVNQSDNIVPPRIAFDVKLATSSGLLQGTYFVTIRIGSLQNIKDGNMQPFKWIRSYSDVIFNEGVASFVLGDESNPIRPSDLNDEDTVIHIEVNELTAAFPLPSVPYSIYSESSLFAEEIHAEDIIGSFITTVNVANDLIVSQNNSIVLYVDSDQQRMGIGKVPTQGYVLDVNGSINASNYLINDKSIESYFGWDKNNGTVSYQGKVGIGTDSPDYDLHVSGNINASEYWVMQDNNVVSLETYLSDKGLKNWRTHQNGIYFSQGNVGIGTSDNIVESLVVSGAIKLSQSIQNNPVDGTIEYKNNDFIGYADGTPFSLIGIRPVSSASITPGAIPYFVNSSYVDVTQNFRVVTDNTGFLGVAIGTNNATGSLTISGDGENPYFQVLDSNNDPLFVVNNEGYVGIGTMNVEANSLFYIDGIVDASDFLKDGMPLSNSLAEKSFWRIGSTHFGQSLSNQASTDLFYDAGFVGIGTDTPINMLELSSSEKVALTFDIDNIDLFTIGVSTQNQSTFIISQGGDLTDPIFSFSNDSKLGIGIATPQVSLHVSGNAGFLVEGKFDDNFDLSSSFDGFSGSGMFYIPEKSVFRAGYANNEWDPDFLGDFSAAFGYYNKASGKYSFVGGGYENIASGDFSVVPGGFRNEALGRYSFAGGYYAQASHDGTFVWSDASSSTNRFGSIKKNQFLVRAFGGVGINTNQTGDASLVVQNLGQGNILNLKGSMADDSNIIVSSKGQFFIGDSMPSSIPDDVKLAVSGRVGIGTTDSKALLHIENEDSQTDYLVYIKGTDGQASSNVFVITNTGNVGIGTAFPSDRLTVGGSIKADTFLMRDPSNPSGYSQMVSAGGSPFSLDNDDAYRVKGFIGLGTRTPNSLLELSNQNDIGSMPVITFDYDQVDMFKMGLITSNEGVYFAMATSPNFTSQNASLVITNNSVIIGRGLVTSNYALDVSGNMFVNGKMVVASNNVHPDYDVFINGDFAVSTLNIAGVDFVPKGENPWKTQGNILFSSPNYNVAIGTDNATEALVVDGSVKVNNLIISANQFQLDGTLDTKKVLFQDHDDTDKNGALFVENGDLQFEFEGVRKNLSSSLQAVDFNTSFSGPLAFWVNDNSLSFSPFFWDGVTNQLDITSNVSIQNYEIKESGFRASSNVFFEDTVGMGIHAFLDHKGITNVAETYSLSKMSLDIEQDWGNLNTPVSIKGIDLAISNTGDILNKARVVGVYVDVSSVNVTANARVYAAQFLGGNVGVGVERPSVALEVNGVISANYFNLTSGINLPSLIVDEANHALVVETIGTDTPAVGIGVSDPSVQLEVAGTISANLLSVSGLEVVTLNIGNGNFVVDDQGNIGIGTEQPSASFQINNVLDEIPEDPYIAEKIKIDIDGVDQLGGRFYFAQDVTGLSLDLNTTGPSYINSTVKGLDIDLSSVNIQGDSKLYGLYVDVDNDSVRTDGNSYAAIFEGGNVGIGVSNPSVALDVNGTINATALFLTGGIEIDNSVTINQRLVVENIASFNQVTMNSLYVKDSFYATSVSFEDQDIDVSIATFNIVTANSLYVDGYSEFFIVSANYLNADTAVFTNGLSVGTSNVENKTFIVNGSFKADSAVFENTVMVPTLSVDNGNTLFLSDGKIGVGTKQPSATFHIVSQFGSNSFDPTDTQTWQAFGLGIDTNLQDQSVGILLSPSDTISKNVGSGVLAQRIGDDASNLLFVTDPYNGDPSVRMVISSDGAVGIGDIDYSTFDRSDRLYVKGTSTFTDLVTIDRLSVDYISSSSGSDELLISSNKGVRFNSSVSFNQGLYLGEALSFDNTLSSHPQLSGEGQGGYIYAYEDDLYFVNQSVSKNITSAYTGTPFAIPYYDAQGNLNDDAPLQLYNNVLKIGASNKRTSFVIESVITSNSLGDNVLEQIIVTFDRRSSGGTRFAAFDIQMNGKDASLPQDEGRLGDGETAIGLNVDMTNLQGTNKYSAIFNGGNVGIGTTQPSSLFHIVGSGQLNDFFRVDNTLGDSLFVIDNKGYLGIVTSNPSSLLSIQKPDAFTDDLFTITSSNQRLFSVDSLGNVSVFGDVSANLGVFNNVSANSLTIAGGMFFVSSNGGVGFGTKNIDEASLTIYRQINSSSPLDYIGEKLDFRIDGTSALSQEAGSQLVYTYESDLTGFSLTMDSESDNFLGNDIHQAVATGVSINVRDLTLGSQGKVYGLYVDVGDELVNGGSRYGAYFNGNVGIGDLTPSYSLTVSGSIYSQGLIVENGGLTVNMLTVNSMVVDSLKANQDVFIVGDLTAESVTVNSLKVNQSVNVREGIYNYVTINEQLVLDEDSRFLIGVSNVADAGSNLIYVSGNTVLNGTLDVDQLTVSIISANNDVISIQGIISANQMITAASVSANIVQFISQTQDPSADNTLFVKDDTLFFKDSNSNTLDLTSYLMGDVGVIPVYYSDNSVSATLTSNAYALRINNDSLELGGDIDSQHQNLGIRVNSKVSNSYTGHLVSVTLNAISAGAKFTGYKIDFESEDSDVDPSNWARLADGDGVVGFHVDLSNTLEEYYDVQGNMITPKKYAALFDGGFVGVGTSDPQATLHVKQRTSSLGARQDIFRVDTALSNTAAFIVDEFGQVGINTDDPLAQFTILNSSNNTGLLLASSNYGIVFSVTSNAVGIGVEASDQAFLSVSGNVLISSSDGSSVLFVSQNKVSIGHDHPEASLDIKRNGSDSLMRINNGNDDVAYVSYEGDFYFGRFNHANVDTKPLYDFNVVNPTSAMVLVSHTDNIDDLTIPTLLTNDDTYGFMSANNDGVMFLGQSSNDGSMILFGGTSPTLNFVVSSNSTTVNVLSMSDSGVGILMSPLDDVALSVSKNFLVGTDSLFVTKNFVGIGTAVVDSSVSLNVAGSLKVNGLEVSSGGMSVTTLNVFGKFRIEDVITESERDYTSSMITLNLNVDLNANSLYGLKINMESLLADSADEDSTYLVAGGGDAYGVYVDMSGLEVAGLGTGTYSETYYGNKYAAVFKGGSVGIGTVEPRYPLEVVGEPGEVIAGFGSVDAGLVIREFGEDSPGVVGLNVVNYSSSTLLEHIGITIKPDSAQTDSFVPALVGIGTFNPDKALVVKGDVRLGVLSQNPVQGAYGRYGSKLFFSGGIAGTGIDSDNGDDLWMARYNASDKDSHLRLNFSTIDSDANDENGQGDGDDMFVVGYTKNNEYTPVFRVHNNSKVSILSEGDTTAANPENTFYVQGSASEATTTFGSYTSLLEREGSGSGGVLALTYNTNNPILDTHKYIGFFNSGQLIGSIEGNGNNGIRYVTSGADYAEYLKKRDQSELFEKGDIVGVVNGLISKDITNFQQLMVLSSAAAVAGNWPSDDKNLFELVAFYGQVPTKVKGKVVKGDFIIVGDGNNGIGVAKSKTLLTVEDRSRIVGRAWESSNERGVKLINTAVGFAFGNYSLNDEMETLNDINLQLSQLKRSRETLLVNYQQTLDRQTQKIESLLLELEKSR